MTHLGELSLPLSSREDILETVATSCSREKRAEGVRPPCSLAIHWLGDLGQVS